MVRSANLRLDRGRSLLALLVDLDRTCKREYRPHPKSCHCARSWHAWSFAMRGSLLGCEFIRSFLGSGFERTYFDPCRLVRQVKQFPQLRATL